MSSVQPKTFVAAAPGQSDWSSDLAAIAAPGSDALSWLLGCLQAS
jgi:hypothetical protein